MATSLDMQQRSVEEEKQGSGSTTKVDVENTTLDIADPTSQEEAQENVNTQTNAKAMEMELKSNLRMIHALVGTRVDIQNIDQVLQQRLNALATLRSEELEKQGQQKEETEQKEGDLESEDQHTVENENNNELKVDGNNNNDNNEVDSKDVRTEFVLESIQLLVALEGVLLKLVQDREINDPANDKELLGLMDQRMIHTMLEIVVCWGIYPCLLPGVGMPLNRRVRSNIVQKELFTTGPGAGFTTMGSILASRHVPDLYAALLQLAYRPLPKPKEAAQNEGGDVVMPEQEATTLKPKKMTPGSLISKSAKQESKPLQPSLADEDGPERARQLQQKEESAKLSHDLFWNTEAARSLESLTILLSSSSPMHPTPAWLKSVSGRFLSQILLRPGGVRVVLEYMQGGAETVKLDQLEKIARLVTSVPDQMSSVQEYYRTICPELLEILAMDLGLLDPEKSRTTGNQQFRIAPPSPQLVQTTTFVVSKLLTKNPVICQVEIVAKEVEPLWKWGTRANRKVPVAADTVPRSHSGEKNRVSLIEEISDNNEDDDDDDSSDANAGLDPVVASEYEVTKAILFLHSFLVGNEPSPLLFQAFLSQAAQGLYQLYEFLTQVRSVLREKAKEILVVYFRILDPNDTVEVLKAIASFDFKALARYSVT
ncbi:transmembrane and coiled-coil domains-containing protein 7 [Mortierella sp. AD094]|nr:transmembrane and coiled-coil domains-containing protein 7 [Mortierella sp. AD094]